MNTSQTIIDNNFINSAIDCAWNNIWHLVKQHPNILRWRESHLHFEFACEITRQFSRFKQWEDYQIVFDSPDALNESGPIDWSLVASIRPDIAIIQGTNQNWQQDTFSRAIEIKILRSLKDVEYEDGEIHVCNLSYQQKCWQQDCRKLQAIADSFNSKKYQGILYTINYHENARCAARSVFKKIDWQDEYSYTSTNVLLRRNKKVFSGNAKSDLELLDS